MNLRDCSLLALICNFLIFVSNMRKVRMKLLKTKIPSALALNPSIKIQKMTNKTLAINAAMSMKLDWVQNLMSAKTWKERKRNAVRRVKRGRKIA